MTPDEFKRKFRYKKGLPSLFGRDIRKTAEGDCGAYAWTMLLILEGGFAGALKAQLKGRAVLWRVQSQVNGKLPRHVALWHRSYGWTDSTEKDWRDAPAPHKLRWPLFVEKLAVLAALAYVAKLWGWW